MRFIYQTIILGLSPLALAKFASNGAGDQNWCGYAIKEAITFIDGSYQIPTVAVPANGDTNTFYSNSQWVGLDGVGNLCSSGLLQAGTTGYVSSSPQAIFHQSNRYLNKTHHINNPLIGAIRQSELLCLGRVLPGWCCPA